MCHIPSGASSVVIPGVELQHMLRESRTPRLMRPVSPQAVPSFQMPVSPHIYTSISWATPSTAASLSPVSALPVGTLHSCPGPWRSEGVSRGQGQGQTVGGRGQVILGSWSL